MNALIAFGLIPGLREGVLRPEGGDPIPVRFANPASAKSTADGQYVCLSGPVRVAPRSVTTILVDLPDVPHRKDRSAAVIHDTPYLRVRRLRAPATVYTIVDGKVPLRIYNPNNRAVNLPKDLRVAKVYRVEQENTIFLADIVGGKLETPPASDHPHDIATHGLDPVKKRQIIEILEEFSEAFAKDERHPGIAPSLEPHQINTSTEVPVVMPSYRLSQKELQAQRETIEEWLQHGIITESNSPWRSRLVSVPKKDGTRRICLDARGLNAVTIPDQYPMPRIEDILQMLMGCRWFSLLDAATGFQQLVIRQEDRHKTAFATANGLYEFVAMPFGLRNAPASFQRAMDKVLHGLLNRCANPYIDDVLVYSREWPEHLDHLRAVLRRFIDHGVHLKLSKCRFGLQEIEYCGHIITPSGIKPRPAKIEAIQQRPPPRNVKALRRFLGLAGYYRRFVKGYSDIVDPLHKLLQKDVKWEWLDEHQRAFDDIKAKLTSTPVLAHPDHSLPFILKTDASGVAIGAVLCQVQNGVERTIEFFGRGLTKQEKGWSTPEKECFAAVEAVKHFRHFLIDQPFTLQTDHKALLWLHKNKDTDSKLLRWSLKLDRFNFTIEHIEGKKNVVADAISRPDEHDDSDSEAKTSIPSPPPAADSSAPSHPTAGNGEMLVLTKPTTEPQPIVFPPANTASKGKEPLPDAPAGIPSTPAAQATNGERRPAIPVALAEPPRDLHPESLNNIDWAAEQRKSHDLLQIINFLEKKELPPRKRDAHRVEVTASSMELIDGKLYRIKTGEKSVCRTFVVPRQLVARIILACHDDAIGGGHLGFRKTLWKIKQRFYWEGMYADTKLWVQSCKTCQSRRRPGTAPHGHLQPIEASEPGQIVAIDIAELPRTRRGNRYVVTMIDYFTRYPQAYATSSVDAATIAKCLRKWCLRFGYPQKLLSDRGTVFLSSVVQSFLAQARIQQLLTTPYHPQTDGLDENWNGTLKRALAMYAHEGGKFEDNWDELLDYVIFSYVASKHESTGVSPFKMLHGFEPKLPVEITSGTADYGPPLSPEQYVLQLAEALRDIHTKAAANSAEAKAKQKARYDARRTDITFKKDDLVWMYLPNQTGLNKFDSKWTGPFRIFEVKSPLLYRLATRDGSTVYQQLVPVQRLKRYTDPAKRPTLDALLPENTEDLDPAEEWESVLKTVNDDIDREDEQSAASTEPEHSEDDSSDQSEVPATLRDIDITLENAEKIYSDTTKKFNRSGFREMMDLIKSQELPRDLGNWLQEKYKNVTDANAALTTIRELRQKLRSHGHKPSQEQGPFLRGGECDDASRHDPIEV